MGAAVHVWDLRRRQPNGFPVRIAGPNLAFSPDGRQLAIVGAAKPTQIRDTGSGRLVSQLRTPYDSRSVTFSPDGRMVLTGHHDGTVQVWSTTSWKPVGRLIEAHEGKRVLWMGFAHGGATLATAGQDGSIELTDMKTRSAVGSPLSVEPQDFVAAALSPDGRHLFALATNRVALRWDLSVQAWKQQACRVAGRELTRREWDDALPGAPYRTVCRPG